MSVPATPVTSRCTSVAAGSSLSSPPITRPCAIFSPMLGCAPIHTPPSAAFSGSSTRSSCKMNSHFGVPYCPEASAPTSAPFLSLAGRISTATPGRHLPPMSIDGMCAMTSRPSASRTSPTYGLLFRADGRRTTTPLTRSEPSRSSKQWLGDSRAGATAAAVVASSLTRVARAVVGVVATRFMSAGGLVRWQRQQCWLKHVVAERVPRLWVWLFGASHCGLEGRKILVKCRGGVILV